MPQQTDIAAAHPRVLWDFFNMGRLVLEAMGGYLSVEEIFAQPAVEHHIQVPR